MSSELIEITVVGKRCVYINDYRVAGAKPYVSENLLQHSFNVQRSEIFRALGVKEPLSKTEELATITQLQAELSEAREALKPFADCCDQIGDDEDDDEWAKFRLEVKNYRDAKRVAAAIEARDWSNQPSINTKNVCP